MLFALFIVITCVLVLYLYRSSNQKYWSKRGVPSSTPQLFFGHYKDVVFAKRHIAQVFHDFYQQFPAAPLVGYLKMSQPCVMVRDPALVKEVLVTQFKNYANNDIHIDKKVDKLFGNNPFVLKDEEWKMTRGHLTPTVTTARLKTYYPAVTEVSHRLGEYVARLLENSGGRAEVEAKELSIKYTTDVVANAVMGLQVDSFSQPDNMLVQITRSVFKGTMMDNLKWVVASTMPFLHDIIGVRLVSYEAETAIVSFTKRVLASRTEGAAVGAAGAGGGRLDFFQHMLNCRNNDTEGVFTDEYIASHCLNFLLDGTETSSILMCFTLFELAWNEEVQEKLREEISEKKKEIGGELSYDHIAQLTYLDMVIAETLRLHPPAMMLIRTVTKPTTLAGVPLDVGTPVAIPVYSLHSDPRYYPQPDTFDPDRFQQPPQEMCIYLPFGEGPRICPGSKFAVLQVKCGVAALVSRVRLLAASRSPRPPPVDPTVLIKRPLGGAWITLQPL